MSTAPSWLYISIGGLILTVSHELFGSRKCDTLFGLRLEQLFVCSAFVWSDVKLAYDASMFHLHLSKLILRSGRLASGPGISSDLTC